MMLMHLGRDALLVLFARALLTGTPACVGASPDRPTVTPATALATPA